YASDITARKLDEQLLRRKTDELQRSNADLEQFAYSVSHDMRQPLRTITGHLQLLASSLKEQLDENCRENLEFVLDGARRMDAMIVSLLEYSRVGRKMESKSEIVSRQALDEALFFLEPVIRQAKALIDIAGEWPSIVADLDELTRLFQNLIGNALKYQEQDSEPKIWISSRLVGGDWLVEVKDNGIGIDPAQGNRLFQFFSRLQPRSRFDGTGMGLALCRRIVEHHGGRIWLESDGSGQGSIFSFSMPVASGAALDVEKAD
ncbi:MAG: ATP-binding protein, partial [Methylomonas sp.]|nr:ATP-binding protein [Methylomonas sp.]